MKNLLLARLKDNFENSRKTAFELSEKLTKHFAADVENKNGRVDWCPLPEGNWIWMMPAWEYLKTGDFPSTVDYIRSARVGVGDEAPKGG